MYDANRDPVSLRKHSLRVRFPNRVPLGGKPDRLLILLCRVPAQRHRAHLESMVSLDQVFCCLWSHWSPDPNTHLPGGDSVTVQ